jgi:nucleoside-diphosphate-sugar epimerase
MSEQFTVFGSDGFVGRRLVNKLVGDGHKVLAVRRGDVLDLVNTDLGHVMYCVGVTGSRFKTEQFNVVDAHVSSMARILEKSRFASFLYMSSARVYEESLTGTEVTARFGVDPSSISDFYNLSKLMGESLILNCDVPNVRIARVSYAVDFADDSTDNISVFLRDAMKGSVIFTAHEQSVKDYVVMNDVLGILPRIALHGKNSIYNVASGVNVSTRQIADLLVEETGCSIEFVHGEQIRNPQPIDISLLVNEMSYRPTSLLDYARQVIQQGSLK